MNQLIAIFFPSIISFMQCEKLFGESKNKKQIIVRYMLSVLFVNIIMYGLTIYIFKKPYFTFTNLFTLKYMVLSTIFAYILPIIIKFITNIIKIDFKVERNEK